MSSSPRFKAALVDLSGTLHIGDTIIPGALEAIRTLHTSGIAVKFLTNTSKVSSQTLLQQLRSMGFDSDVIPDMSFIITSSTAAKLFLAQHNLRPLCLVEDDLLRSLEIDMPRPTRTSAQTVGGVGRDDYETTTRGEHNCVLIGLAPNSFHYEALNEAFRLLLRLKSEHDKVANKQKGETSQSAQHMAALSGSTKQTAQTAGHFDGSEIPMFCPLLAIHRANYYRDEDNELSLGPGAFITALEQATSLQAHVIGKPSSSFFHAAVDSLNDAVKKDSRNHHECVDNNECIQAEEVVMIGDDVVQDVCGAIQAGLGGGILVQTGKYMKGDEKKSSCVGSGANPTITVGSIVEAVQYIISGKD